MVAFTASLIGAAAVLARVTSAVPTDYGMGSGSGSGKGMSSMSSSAAAAPAPSMSMGSGSSGYGSKSSSPPSSSSYGSGSSNWNKGGYDSCVQQCVAQFGTPSSMMMPPSMTSSSGSSGNGKTHTVVVAPTQGVLRYVPFVVNASVGDTVKYIWGANNHTVTKSSQLALCNKTGDKPFASGEQNKTFVFTQVVNDTNPTFFYCGTPTHCQKGMFGIINPPNAFMGASSAGMMMGSLAGQYNATQAAMSYTKNATASQPNASMWGMNIDMGGMPNWSQPYAADNVLFTQAFIAMNPETLQADGSIDLSGLASNPVMVPTDVAAALYSNNADNSTSSSGYGSPASPSTPSSAAASASSSAVGGSKASSNSAGALSSPHVAVALVAVLAASLAL
jgi:plastocyanin